jgi:hypothetical protein
MNRHVIDYLVYRLNRTEDYLVSIARKRPGREMPTTVFRAKWDGAMNRIKYYEFKIGEESRLTGGR